MLEGQHSTIKNRYLIKFFFLNLVIYRDDHKYYDPFNEGIELSYKNNYNHIIDKNYLSTEIFLKYKIKVGIASNL